MMLHAAPRILALTLPACLLAFTGCKGDEESGVLTVSYTLGKATSTCETEEVDEVKAVLGDGEYEAEAKCGSDIVFSDVDAGTYSLVVEAVDGSGFAVMDNVEDADSQQVEILGGSSRDVEAELSAAPARIFVRWSLMIDDFSAMCGGSGVTTDEFEVSIWDQDSDKLHEHTFACDDDPDGDSGYHSVPDPDRLIKGSSIVEVDVAVLPSDHLVPFTFEPPGRGRELLFTVSCEDNVCEGTMMPN